MAGCETACCPGPRNVKLDSNVSHVAIALSASAVGAMYLYGDYHNFRRNNLTTKSTPHPHTIISAAGVIVGTVSAVVSAVHALPHNLTPDALVAGLATVAIAIVSHGLFSAATAKKVTQFVNTVEPDVAAAVDAIPNLRGAVVTAGNKMDDLEKRVSAVEVKAAATVKDVAGETETKAMLANLKAVLEGPAVAAVQPPAAS